MCGIAAGSKLYNVYKNYESNLDRGCFSTGVLLLDQESKSYVLKQPGIISIDQIKSYIKDNNLDIRYILMHSRAPTNTGEQEFNTKNNHPFSFVNHHVAHNGIITNFSSFDESKSCTVDSNIIPIHLHHGLSIADVYSKYEGLLTSWIYKSDTNEIFFVKAGSTLFYYKDYFSSTEFKDSIPVEDGEIYILKGKKFKLYQKFNYTNPFYV